MNRKLSLTILSNGLIVGLLLSAIVLLSWSFGEPKGYKNLESSVMFALAAGMFYLMRVEINKAEVSESSLELREFWYGVFSIFIGTFSLCGYLITFSNYWLADDIRYFCLALGLPILFALITREVLRKVQGP